MYRSPNIVRVIKSTRVRWAGRVARMEKGKSAFKMLTGEPTGKIPLWRPRRRRKDNIRMNLKGIGINTRNRVDSAQDRKILEYCIVFYSIVLYCCQCTATF